MNTCPAIRFVTVKLAVCCAALLASASVAAGDWDDPVRADFNGLVAGQLEGQSGGDGLASEPWAGHASINVVADELLADPETNFNVTQQGGAGAVRGDSGASVQVNRALAQPLHGNVWFSFLLKQSSPTSRGGITFNSSASNASIIPRVVGVGQSLFVDFSTDDDQDGWLSQSFPVGETVLVVGCVELNILGEANDRLSVWVNPDVAALGAADMVLSGADAFGDAIERVGITSYYWGEAAEGGVVDHLSLATGPTAFEAVTGQTSGDYAITFADEFEEPTLDLDRWIVDSERPNVIVEDGKLRLVTELVGEDYICGKLGSHQMQRFGYYEARFSIGGDTGQNNAFWLTTASDLVREDNGTPQYVDRVEVDINEVHYPDEMNITLHDWAPDHWAAGRYRGTVDAELVDELHSYAFEWRTNNSMIWYFDGQPQLILPASDANETRSGLPLTILFSTAVLPFAGQPGPNLDGTSMDVEYVRVYQRPGWTGSTSGLWSDSANWGPDGVPGVDGAAVFNRPTPNTTVTLDADVAIREVYFENAATPAIAIGGEHTLMLGEVSGTEGVSSVTLNSDVSADQTFDVDIVGRRDFIIGNYSLDGAKLVFNGGLDGLAPGRLLHLGGGEIEINGSIGANIADLVNFTGARTTLAATSAFPGITDIQGGMLTITTNGALGAGGASSSTLVADEATLALAGGIDVSADRSLEIEGDGFEEATGAMVVADNSTVAWRGSVGLTNDAVISSGVQGGTLELLGSVNGRDSNASALTIAGTGEVHFRGLVGQRIHDVVKTGAGTAYLDAFALYSGSTTIAEGMLALGASGTTGASDFIDVQSNAAFDVSAKSAAYTVASARTLHAAGTVVGAVSVANGGRFEGDGQVAGSLELLPGATMTLGVDHDSATSLTVAGDLTLAKGSTMSFVDAAVASGVRVTHGALAVSDEGVVTLSLDDPAYANAGVYTLIDAHEASAASFAADDFSLSASSPTGDIRVVDRHLVFVSLTSASQVDFDADGDIDLDDFASFVATFTGPGEQAIPAGVTVEQFIRSDIDADGDVDLEDFQAFQKACCGQ